jgi:hypothetical protein
LDNPTALADLEPVAEFDISTSEVQTMHAVEITARVREGGSRMHLRDAQIEIRPPSGPVRIVALEGDRDGYEALFRFYESGEHHLRLLGRPELHNLIGEMGEFEIDVEPQHQIHGDRRFDLEVIPGTIIPGMPAQVRLLGWKMDPDGNLVGPAGGLALHAELHLPGDIEVQFVFNEVAEGEYQLDVVFPAGGSYDLSIEVVDEDEEIPVAGTDPEETDDDEEHGADMAFRIHVPSLAGDGGDSSPVEGGDGGHGH